ncbi:MAG: hypothetical protein KAW83_04295, partial [Dehalococcoidia bacterium]|nr:hypothetical protein [Dehalococcoidia bacterium]
PYRQKIPQIAVCNGSYIMIIINRRGFLHYCCSQCYNARGMVLSGRTIKEEIAKRRIVVEPRRSDCYQIL